MTRGKKKGGKKKKNKLRKEFTSTVSAICCERFCARAAEPVLFQREGTMA